MPQKSDGPKEEKTDVKSAVSESCSLTSSEEQKISKTTRGINLKRLSRYRSSDLASPKLEEEQVQPGFASGNLNEIVKTRYQEAAESLEEALQSADVKLIKLMEQEALSQVSKDIELRAESQSEGHDDEDSLYDVIPADVEELLRDVNPEDVEKLLESEDMDAMLQEITEDDCNKSNLLSVEKRPSFKNDSDIDGISDSAGAVSDGAESDDECSSDEIKKVKRIKVTYFLYRFRRFIC